MIDHLRIFDTTLRDGEQSPGISLDVAEKLEIAEQLARLGVDIIEAGFPIASPGDFEAVEAIARGVRGPVITALSRTGFQDIDRAWEAVQHAEPDQPPRAAVPHRYRCSHAKWLVIGLPAGHHGGDDRAAHFRLPPGPAPYLAASTPVLADASSCLRAEEVFRGKGTRVRSQR